MRQLDVVVVGAVGVDTNVYLYGAEIDFSVEMNFARNLDTVGQAGGYSARLARRLGYRTGLIGYIGDDFCGEHVRRTLQDDGVDCSALHVDPAGTKRSVNFMYPDGRRRNFYDGRGSMDVHPDLDRCAALLGSARMAHFAIVNWARELLAPARAARVPVCCDLQDVVSPDDPYREDFVVGADLLFCSSVNAADPTALLDALARRARPGALLVCGMGAEGCAVRTPDGLRRFGPVQLPEPVRDTNGAGDSLAVGMATGLWLEALSLEQAVLRGQIAARHTCTLVADSAHLIDSSTLARYTARLSGA